MRDVIGPALLALGKRRKDFFIVDADNGPATRVQAFGDVYQDRYVNVGCAEQNMLGVAAGIASTGRPVIAATFSIFLLGRAFEQARNTIAASRLPVVLLGTHAGLSTGADGGSHCCPEDIALARSIPGMSVYIPACDDDIPILLLRALESGAPCYIRVPRSGIWPEESSSSVPKLPIGSGLRCWKSGEKTALVTTGLMLPRVLQVADNLEAIGCPSIAVYDMPVLTCSEEYIAETLYEFDNIVTIEDHWPVGGLGDLISYIVASRLNRVVLQISANHVFPSSGKPEDVLDDMGLGVNYMAHKIGKSLEIEKAL